MKQLSPRARRLFELARGQDEPDAETRRRVARALSMKVAAGASLTAAGASAAGWGMVLAKSALAIAVTGGLATGAWLTLRTPRPAHPPVASPPPAPLVAKPAPAVPVAETPSREPPPSNPAREPGKVPSYRKLNRPPMPPAPTDRSPAVGADDGLRAETEALRLAQQALRKGRPEQALRLLDEQDLRFREGLLLQERAAARILALCQAGRVEEARRQAIRFERAWPRSALLGRVRAACPDR